MNMLFPMYLFFLNFIWVARIGTTRGVICKTRRACSTFFLKLAWGTSHALRYLSKMESTGNCNCCFMYIKQ